MEADRPRDDSIVFENVSRFYGEVLGINRVNLILGPGITGLVGPNGSGKSTLMNLVTGLLRPTQGRVRVLGLSTDQPEVLFRRVGYCSQFDGFPKGLTGYQFLYAFLRVHGFGHGDAERLAWRAIDRVGLRDAAGRKVAAYSKGMRQRIKLAQALAHEPRVLVLDEPLNGLDPMARAEVLALLEELRQAGCSVLLSSHILHELDVLSDRVVLLDSGYIVAEGEVEGVRDEMEEHPLQILIRCDRPELVAAAIFEHPESVGAQLHRDRRGLVVSTRDADRFHLLLNRIVVDRGLDIERVEPADADVHALYEYLIGATGELR
ncbi:MAG: ABC transporter ATP-binding protein [Acidobacteria bacterium]|nr:ABC transporter ATP-binding protein [Acidobacteriota bacterium]